MSPAGRRKKRNFKAISKYEISEDDTDSEEDLIEIKAKQKRSDALEQINYQTGSTSFDHCFQNSSNFEVDKVNDEKLCDDNIVKKVSLIASQVSQELVDDSLINYKKFKKVKLNSQVNPESYLVQLKLFKS